MDELQDQTTQFSAPNTMLLDAIYNRKSKNNHSNLPINNSNRRDLQAWGEREKNWKSYYLSGSIWNEYKDLCSIATEMAWLENIQIKNPRTP